VPGSRRRGIDNFRSFCPFSAVHRARGHEQTGIRSYMTDTTDFYFTYRKPKILQCSQDQRKLLTF
jgi:hypothetical protein